MQNRKKLIITVSLICLGALVLIGLAQTGANYWQNMQILQSENEMKDLKYQEASDYMIKLNKREGFFGARYKGCHIEKNPIICTAFYPATVENSNSTKLSQAAILNSIRKAKWDEIMEISQSQSIKAISSLKPKELKKLENIILNEKVCIPSTLSSALSYEIEESFPNPVSVQKSKDLYIQAMKCQKENPEKDKGSTLGSYRLGLISLWLKDYDLAQESLEHLLEISDNELFISRAKFWLNKIKLSKNENLSNSTLAKSFSLYPLSFHSVLDFENTDENKPFMIVSDLSSVESESFSEIEELNQSVSLYKSFQASGEVALAKRTLEFLNFDLLKKAKPQFRLYIAEQLNNFEELKHEKFKVLSKLFQENPKYKTIKNLKLYYPLDYANIVSKNNSNQNPFFILALIRQESSFNPNTESPVGALGLMQIMPRTAQELRRGVNRTDLLDPHKNIQLGARYLKALVKEFNQDEQKALAAYNAGAGNVRKWNKRFPGADSMLFSDLIPFDETREYVANIMRNKYWYGKLYPDVNIESTAAIAQQTQE